MPTYHPLQLLYFMSSVWPRLFPLIWPFFPLLVIGTHLFCCRFLWLLYVLACMSLFKHTHDRILPFWYRVTDGRLNSEESCQDGTALSYCRTAPRLVTLHHNSRLTCFWPLLIEIISNEVRYAWKWAVVCTRFAMMQMRSYIHEVKKLE